MGKIICTGLGPGDPDLMSLRAHRAVTSATQVAYFRKAGRAGQARRIVTGVSRSRVCDGGSGERAGPHGTRRPALPSSPGNARTLGSP